MWGICRGRRTECISRRCKNLLAVRRSIMTKIELMPCSTVSAHPFSIGAQLMAVSTKEAVALRHSCCRDGEASLTRRKGVSFYGSTCWAIRQCLIATRIVPQTAFQAKKRNSWFRSYGHDSCCYGIVQIMPTLLLLTLLWIRKERIRYSYLAAARLSIHWYQLM